MGTATFFTMDAIVVAITRHYPGLKQTLPRVAWMLAAFAVITTGVILSGFWLYTSFRILDFQFNYAKVREMLILNFMANIVSVGVYECIHSVTEWKVNMQEKEQLRKVNLQSQFESLKNQVSPHFLFNSLNSLSSLISRDSHKAEQYVGELSNVYQYLLQTNHHDLTTVASELAFIGSYFHLLTIRFGAAISLEVNVSDALLSRQLPPLTLQLLVENAVKHNVVRISKPLKIEILSLEDGRLLVRNNLQRKNTPVASNHVGLSNIAAKYRLLAAQEIEVADTDGFFSVRVPLLAEAARLPAPVPPAIG
jgi:LytS/YehU family sensor histidine kinase